MGDLGTKFITIELAKCPRDRSSVGYLNADLCGNNIHGEGVNYLSQLLTDSSIVQKVNLSDNDIQQEAEDGLVYLCKAIRTPSSTLVELNLSLCSLKITAINGPVVVDMLQKNKALRILILSFNEQIQDVGIEFIAKGLKVNKKLKLLKAERVGMTTKGATYLAESLEENSTLAALHICCNQIEDSGVLKLSRSLIFNKTLKNLHVRNCGITAYGIEYLLTNLVNSSLRVLNCSYNDLSGFRGGYFVKLNLTALYLRRSKLHDNELISLCKVLKNQESIKFIDLQLNHFTKSGLDALSGVVQTINHLTSLRLSGSLKTIELHTVKQFLCSLIDTSVHNVNLFEDWKEKLSRENLRFNQTVASHLKVHYHPIKTFRL